MADMHVFRVEYTENHCGPFTKSVRRKTICRHVERWMDYIKNLDNPNAYEIVPIKSIQMKVELNLD